MTQFYVAAGPGCLSLCLKVYYNFSLCVIFTILVSFFWTNALVASKAKINSGYPSGTLRSKKFQTTLILGFEANSAFVPRK